MGQKYRTGLDFFALGSSQKNSTAVLVLEDGIFFTGFDPVPKPKNVGEICFNTSITGYQEILDRISYAGRL